MKSKKIKSRSKKKTTSTRTIQKSCSKDRNIMHAHKIKPLNYLSTQDETLTLYLNNLLMNNLSDQVLITGPIGSGKTHLIMSCLTQFDKGHYQLINYDGIAQNQHLSSLDQLTKPETFLDLTFSDSETLTSATSRKSIIIVDHVELFCLNNRQQFLYNLFQLSINKDGILVILVSSRPDVIELFEKRVRSRFTHNQIITRYPNNRTEIEETTKHFLGVEHLDNAEAITQNIYEKIELSSYSLYTIRNYCFESEVTGPKINMNPKTTKISLTQKEKKILAIVKTLHQAELPISLDVVYDKYYKQCYIGIDNPENIKGNRMEVKHIFENLRKKGIIEYQNKTKNNIDADYAQCVFNPHLEIQE